MFPYTKPSTRYKWFLFAYVSSSGLFYLESLSRWKNNNYLFTGLQCRSLTSEGLQECCCLFLYRQKIFMHAHVSVTHVAKKLFWAASCIFLGDMNILFSTRTTVNFLFCYDHCEHFNRPDHQSARGAFFFLMCPKTPGFCCTDAQFNWLVVLLTSCFDCKRRSSARKWTITNSFWTNTL